MMVSTNSLTSSDWDDPFGESEPGIPAIGRKRRHRSRLRSRRIGGCQQLTKPGCPFIVILHTNRFVDVIHVSIIVAHTKVADKTIYLFLMLLKHKTHSQIAPVVDSCFLIIVEWQILRLDYIDIDMLSLI